MVVIQHRIDDEKEAAAGFSAPHWIVRKEDHVSSAIRHVDYGRLLGNFGAVSDHAAQQHLFFRRKAQNHTRIILLIWHTPTGKLAQLVRDIKLLLAWSTLYRLFRWHVRAALNDVRIRR